MVGVVDGECCGFSLMEISLWGGCSSHKLML